ncbi:MAG: helix-turn-helix domain-containing protein [Steroidobacteraceae bacterium]
MPFKALIQKSIHKAYIAYMSPEAYIAPMRRLILQTPAQLTAHLKSLRKARQLTQAQLGVLVGLDQTRIAKIERDPSLISIGQLMQLLTALRVRILLEQFPGPASQDTRTDW